MSKKLKISSLKDFFCSDKDLEKWEKYHHEQIHVE